MNIQELANYNLAEQAQFKLTLNPVIWNTHEHLRTAVRNQILFGAESYCADLGIAESQVVDVVVGGAMASYNYSAASDIDVIIVADLNPDPTFREFFNENRYQYNRQHAVTVGAHCIKFYVQPAEEKITSRGSYSLLSESWLQVAQRKLTEDMDTVLGLKRAEQAAQPAPVKVKKKPVVRERRPTVYGFGREHIMEVGLTPDGTNPTTSQFTNEQAPPSTEETLQDFVKFCAAQLELENEPVLKIRRDPEWSRRNKTFGRFNGATQHLEVSVAGRHMMDVLRTIAHELTHQHQHEREDMPHDAGDTGSEYENEANARAGILMRDYGQDHPHLFADSDELNENWKKWAAGGLAAAALMGAPSQAQGQSIQQGLGAVKNIGTMYNTLKNTNIPAMLQGEAQAELINFITANGGNPNAQNQSTLYQWQKKYQQSQQQQAQTQQASDSDSSQYTQQTVDPQLAAQGDMYSQQLQQHQARQGANEARVYSKLWKFKPCSLSSIELSTILEKSYQSLYEQTGNRWYPHRCSFLAQYVTKRQQGLLEENAQLDTLFKFQDALKNIDGRKNVKIAIGNSVAIIRVIPHTSDNLIELKGFKNPKKIKNIFTDDNDDIEWLEFTDGSTYPDQHFISAGQGGGELEGTNTLFFANKQDAKHAVTIIGFGIPDGWKLSTINFAESSGYIPTKKQARDPRFSTALTKDVRPGTLGKVANAFMLNTNSQGRPQEANPNGTVKRLKEELEFIKLTEAADAEIDNLTVDQLLDYANRMHKAGFQNGVMIKKHPRWKLTTLPIGVLQLKDPGRKDIDNDHVQSITELDLETKPIIVGSRGVIIDGNHRARRAFELGIDSLPAFVPKL